MPSATQISLLTALLCISANITAAQPASQPQQNPQVIHLSLHSAPTTDPALQYILLPPMTDRRPGNGAALYLIGAMCLPKHNSADDDKIWDRIYQQMDADADKFDPREADTLLQNVSFRWFDEAARCDQADWNADLRGQGVRTLLPQLNSMRAIVNVLVVRTRLQLSLAQFPQAQRTLQTILAIASQSNSNPVLVQSLVAAGIVRVTLSQDIEMWITRPSAPNLYWPLTNLPPSFVDLRPMADVESSILAFTDPRFAQALAGTLPPDQWQPTIEQMIRLNAQETSPVKPLSPTQITDQYNHLKQSIYPQAQAQSHQPAASPDQLVGQYLIRQYHTLSDNCWKAWLLPWPQARPLLEQAQHAIDQAQAAGNPFLRLLNKRDRARATFAQLDQHLALLRTIEALRDYAAHHNNQLPNRLDQITDLPLPPDPVTNQPFDYRLQGTTATLTPAPAWPTSPTAQQYELTISQ